jgi:ATP-dependent Clp protease ATP-binding subunit ClpC
MGNRKTKSVEIKMAFDEDDDASENKYKDANKKPVDTKSKTPVLDSFSRDITKQAEEGKIDPVVGREKEIERLSQILTRRKKSNGILIGEAGVGKSAIAEGLFRRRFLECFSIKELLHWI